MNLYKVENVNKVKHVKRKYVNTRRPITTVLSTLIKDNQSAFVWRSSCYTFLRCLGRVAYI